MTGYVLVADLLGFKSIIRNSNPDERERRVAAWLSLVESSAGAAGVERFKVFSDTIFAATASSVDGLKKVVQFGQSLLNRGVPQSLLVRGAVAHGEFEWNEKLIHGAGIVKAHEMEAAQDWVGIGGVELPHADSCSALITYPVPLKRGLLRINRAIDWDVPDITELSKLMMGGGLTTTGDLVDWAIGGKLTNTVLFGTYKWILTERGLDPKKFYGLTPIHLIQDRLGIQG